MMEYLLRASPLVIDLLCWYLAIWLWLTNDASRALLFRLGDSISRVLNVCLYWKRGTANHTVSGDAYRFDRMKTMAVIDWIFSPYESEHCRKSHENDIDRAREFIDEVSMTTVQSI